MGDYFTDPATLSAALVCGLGHCGRPALQRCGLNPRADHEDPSRFRSIPTCSHAGKPTPLSARRRWSAQGGLRGLCRLSCAAKTFRSAFPHDGGLQAAARCQPQPGKGRHYLHSGDRAAAKRPDLPGHFAPCARKKALIGGSAVFDRIDLFDLSGSENALHQGQKRGMIFQEPMTSLNPCSQGWRPGGRTTAPALGF